MLRRFTGVAISDFGCAFNAYRRDAVEPVLGAIGKQKFTKALVLSTGASVVEVDVGARGRAPARRATRRSGWSAPRSHVLAGFWPQPIQWIGLAARRRLHAARARARRLGRSSTGSTTRTSPGPLFGGVAILFVLGVQGFILALVGEYLGRIQRDVDGRPLYTIEREL